MPIKDLRPRLHEIGRLRIGTTTKRGKKTLPTALEHWRFTTPHLDALNVAAKAYGGEIGEWSEGHGSQYELITETDTLTVLVPPQELSQYLELWSGGGAVRRCDGEVELITGAPCICAAGERECSPTTHLQVLLPTLPGIGVWRLTTRGWNAASELQGSIALIKAVRERQGGDPLVAADLVIEQRQSIDSGVTRNFVVPVLRLPYSLAEAGLGGRTLELNAAPDQGHAAIGAGAEGRGSGGDEPAAAPDTSPPTSLSPEEPVAGEDPSPEAPSHTPARGSGRASGARRQGCLHVNGVEPIKTQTGGWRDVCIDCGLVLEITR